MGLSISECPTDRTWREFLDDLCSDADRPALEKHLNECERCQIRLESMISDPKWKQWMPGNQQVQVDTELAFHDETAVDREPAPSEIAKPDIPGYTILDRLGHGGMGAVYRAHQQGLNRFVAIKVLSTPAEQSPERWVRFRTEAEAAGRLVHPNIVRVFDSGEHNSVPYVVQELAEDGSLASKVSGLPQSAEQTTKWMISIADAVEHAHQQGVLHRDIKPSNLLFSGNTIKLADFGLAKLTDGQDVTETHGVIGTPAYMAPEQADGDRDSICPATDVFAMGILLYELLTGIAPFRADTAIESIRLIKEHDPVAPRELQPTVPSDLNTICLKCLAKNPAERYATAGEVTDELRRFAEGLPILAKPPTQVARLWKWTKRRPLTATLMTTALLATLVAITAWAKYTQDIAQFNKKLAAANAAEKREKEEVARQKDEVTKQRDIARKVRYFLIHDLLYGGTAAAQIEELKQQGRDASEYERDPRLSTMLRLAIDSLRGEGLERRFPNQPETQREMLLLLADLSRHSGDNVQSLQLFQRSLSDDHQQHPTKSDLIISNLIALDLVALGQTDEAIETYEWLVEKNRQLGDEKMLAATLHNLSGTYLTAGKSSELALKYVDKAIQIADQQYGPNHPQTLGYRSTRASLLDVLGRSIGSLEELGKVVDGLKRTLGVKHPKTIFNRFKLADSHLKSGRKKDAIDVLRAVVSDSVEVHGDEHPRTIGYRERLEKLLEERSDILR